MEEELASQAEEIEKELSDERLKEERDRRFFRLLAGFFMAVLIIFMVIPFYSVRHNPEPKPVEMLSLDGTESFNFSQERLASINDAGSLDVSAVTRNAAIRIILGSGCRQSETCQAKALFYYVRDNINYIRDPPYEYIQPPEETLFGAGDCEDQAILLAILLKSAGIRSRIVIVPGHAYAEAYIGDAPRRFTNPDGWIPLDPTCSSCGFGEIPRKNIGMMSGLVYV